MGIDICGWFGSDPLASDTIGPTNFTKINFDSMIS